MEILFLDYTNYKCVNNAYQDFVRKFYLKLINTKPWFDTDVLNAIPNCDKHYRKFKQSGTKMTKAVSSVQSFYLKKYLITRKNFALKKKLQKMEYPKEV